MRKSKEIVSADWIAIFPTIFGLMFWPGFLIAQFEGYKAAVGGLSHSFGVVTTMGFLGSPIIALLCGCLLIGKRVSHPFYVTSGFLIGLSPIAYLLLADVAG